MNRHMNVPMTEEEAASLETGDYIYLTGTIYTARDVTHKRMGEALGRGESLPSDIEGSVIYYMEPPPTRGGRTIGSASPTTANRTDKYTSYLLDLDMGATVRRGKRNKAVVGVIVHNGAVYFAAVGGAGAILSKCIFSSEIVTYEDLSTEAVCKLAIQGFPVTVVMNALGNDLYETAVKEFCTPQRGNMRRIIYMVSMNLFHAPIQFFTISRMTREEDTRTVTERYRYILKVVKGINKRGRVTVTAMGTEHISSQDESILFPNHQGLFDMLTLPSTCPRPLSTVIKKEISSQILIKQILGATKNPAMDGDDIEDQARIIAEVIKRVKPGRNPVMSAEGHRSRNGNEILNFKSGTFKGAVKADYSIVPVTLVNSFRPFDMNSLKREEVQVHYMESILPDQYMEVKTSEIAHPVHNRIQEKINRNLTKNGLTS